MKQQDGKIHKIPISLATGLLFVANSSVNTRAAEETLSDTIYMK